MIILNHTFAEEVEAVSLRCTDMLHTLLPEIEEIAGPRDDSWRVLPVQFFIDRDRSPHTYYPRPAERQVLVRLSYQTLESESRRTWQIYHEAVHLLAPGSTPSTVKVIEEGLACWVQTHWWGGGWLIDDGRYMSALAAVEELMEHGPFVIRDIRRRQPSFDDMVPEDITAVVRGVDPLLAERLCQRFSYVREG